MAFVGLACERHSCFERHLKSTITIMMVGFEMIVHKLNTRFAHGLELHTRCFRSFSFSFRKIHSQTSNLKFIELLMA